LSDTEFEIDREYTVPLSRAWIAPRYRRTPRAVNILKEFAQRHLKSSEIKIESSLNEQLWEKGITQPPRRVTVRMTKDEDGLVTISLPKKTPAEEEEAAAPSAQPEERSETGEVKAADAELVQSKDEKTRPEETSPEKQSTNAEKAEKSRKKSSRTKRKKSATS
jgi:large subunit ribosomal protein L31e